MKRSGRYLFEIGGFVARLPQTCEENIELEELYIRCKMDNFKTRLLGITEEAYRADFKAKRDFEVKHGQRVGIYFKKDQKLCAGFRMNKMNEVLQEELP